VHRLAGRAGKCFSVTTRLESEFHHPYGRVPVMQSADQGQFGDSTLLALLDRMRHRTIPFERPMGSVTSTASLTSPPNDSRQAAGAADPMSWAGKRRNLSPCLFDR
jgi:hypothetical protein